MSLYEGAASGRQVRDMIDVLTGAHPTNGERGKVLAIASILYSGKPLRYLYYRVQHVYGETSRINGGRRSLSLRRVEKAWKALQTRVR